MMLKSNSAAGNLSTAFQSNVENSIGGALLRAAVGIFAGLFASRAMMFGKCAPFGIAAVAAASPGYGIFVLLGSITGYLLPGGPDYGMRYVAACAAVFLIKWVLSGFNELVLHPAFNPAIASAAALITGAAIVIAGGAVPYDILILFAETLLCGCSAVFFGQALNYIKKSSGLWGLSQRELISVIISLCVVLLALERVQFSGISLGRIAAIFVILSAARYGKETGGTITGVSTGMFLSLGGGHALYMLPGYGFGGLVAGVFAQFGRFACVLSFALANVIAGITASGSTTQALTGIYETVVASVIFLLVPESLLCRISGVFVPAGASDGRSVIDKMQKRLIDCAKALEDVSETVNEVTGKLSQTNTNDISEVYRDASDDTCKKCGMHMYCWGTVYNDTMSALNDTSEPLKKNRSLKRDDIPKHFAARCCKLTELIGTINRCYAEFLARKAADLKTGQLRRLLAPQLGSAACLLRDVASGFSPDKNSIKGGERVKAALAACGILSKNSEVSVDGRGRITVEAAIEGDSKKVNREAMLSALSASCGRKLEGPEVLSGGEDGAVRLVFRQKPHFSVSFGEAAIQKTGETLCGDACQCFVDDQNRAMLILSDGMGCGPRAAVDSNLTVGLMSKLLKCGFGFDEAVKVTGTAMMVKSAEESLSTLDIACVDLYDGTATFLKAGAPPTYIRRCGQVERIESCSMPIGILSDTKLVRTSVHLHKGDLIVVISDGALQQDDSYIIEAIEKFDGEPRMFAKKLAELAKGQRSDGHDDDITVMAAEIA